MAFCVALAAVAAGVFAWIQWQRTERETQRANVALAKNYWASAVNAQAAGDVLRAAHLFARSGALKLDPSEVNNAIFAVYYQLKLFFLGSQMVHGAKVNGMVFSKDERFILSWDRNGLVRLWRASDEAAIAVMKHEGGLLGVANATFSRDESRILSWGDDGTVRLWDIQSDFDLPRDHIQLLVEVVTGTAMDDIGNVSVLRSEEWTKRKTQYRKIAEEHLITCQYRDANLYLRQKRFWEAGE